MIATLLAAALAAQAPAPAPGVRPGLEPLGFLVGHCWRGIFPDSGEQDTHCFDAVYGGQHVRDRHEVTGGARLYRGESVYSADGAGAVSYTYWNSDGGVSRGSMRPATDRLDFGDEVFRGPDGREMRISSFWRRVGDDAYEAVTRSADAPGMNRTVSYRRVASDVTVSESRAPDGSHILVHEIEIDASAAAVWTAIATADGWRTWAVPRAWASEPDIIETSYSMNAAPGDPSTIRQRILASIPGRMIAFRTVKAPEGFPNFETFRQTIGVIEVEPIGESRTHLRLTGAGYPDTEAGRQLLGFFREGNRTSLEQLRQRFATGPIDWSRRQATTTTGE